MAFCELIKKFKVIIISREESTNRQRAIAKKLSRQNVPFDAFYRKLPIAKDNFFTYDSIKQDFACVH